MKFKTDHKVLHSKADEEYCDDCDKKFCWKCEEGHATLDLENGIALCGECFAIKKAWDRQSKKEKVSEKRSLSERELRK